MTAPSPDRTGAATAALASGAAQAAAALGAHVLAAGCLPGSAGLAVALPVTVLGVLLLGRLLPGRPLLRLAGGQLAGHLALSVAAACSAAAHVDGHAHAGSAGAVMVLAHVGALVLLRAVLDRCVAGVERAVTRLLARRTSPARALRLPAPACPLVPVPTPLRDRSALRVAPVRGPPAGLLPAT